MKFPRILMQILQRNLQKPFGLLLLGPRQVGKTTLLEEILKPYDSFNIFLQDYEAFQAYNKDPGLLKRQITPRLKTATTRKPLYLLIDEVQKIPHLLDDVQLLYDQNKKIFRPIATGSSARKLRRHDINLLPGRVLVHSLHPLIWEELGLISHASTQTKKAVFISESQKPKSFSENAWQEYLLFGSLPGVLSVPKTDRYALLRSYTMTYLKEEIQAEALLRALSGFSRFLELAAFESSNTTNYQKLAKDVGLSVNTIKNFYTILIDTLVAIPLHPYTRNARKRLITTPKIYFFDLGVRNAAAGLLSEGNILKTEYGKLFEHWIFLELYRRIQYFFPDYRLYFWRTAVGAEVDLVIETPKTLIPMAIKAATHTSNINLSGLRHFMAEYACKKGYLIGNFSHPEQLDKGITALPWWCV